MAYFPSKINLSERLNRQLELLEYSITDPKVWTLINTVYFDEYDGDSTTCEITGKMRVPFLDSLRQEVGGSAGERRNLTIKGGVGNYETADRWEEFKQVVVKELFPKGYGCTIQIVSPRNITIYEGNHRIRAAAELGLYDMPVHLKFFHNSEDHLGNIFRMAHIIKNLEKEGILVRSKAGYLRSYRTPTASGLVKISNAMSKKILK